MALNELNVRFFLDPFLCANTKRSSDGKMKPCENEAEFTCGGCNLVQYCLKECQIADWKSHKAICKSRYLKDPYVPRWQTEKRIPEFMGGPPLASFGSLRYLWGNIPALDLLKVAENEGDEAILQNDVSLLFAASGDLRNVIKTVVGLPEDYAGSCKAVINDRDTIVIARNAILLLIALHFEPEVATPIMLHVWYSAMLPQAIVQALQEGILPYIQDVCNKIHKKPEHSMQAKTFVQGRRSVRIVLKKSEWTALAKLVVPSKELTALVAQAVRRAITQARVDHIDRSLYRMPPGRRAGAIDFRQHGVLLPFGASRKEFAVPNPTLFVEQTWPMKDDADPLDGWSYNEYIKCAPIAKSDVYGAFFFYLRDMLLAFCKRIRSFAISFQLLATDVKDLPNYLTDIKFDRIEVCLEPLEPTKFPVSHQKVSNICDRGYIGPRRTLCTFSPLLKPKSQNPTATLLLLFFNVVREEEDHHSTLPDAATRAQRSRLVKRFFSDVKPYLLDAALGKGGLASMQYMTTPEVVLLTDVMTYWDDFDVSFGGFLQNADPDSEKLVPLQKLAVEYGLMIKDKHSIVPPWPYRVTEKTTREEFDVLLAQSTCGQERYVEFGRV